MRAWVCVACLLALTGCQTREISGEAPDANRTLVFEDTFERPALGPNWRVGTGDGGGKGAWRVVKGAVEGRDMHNAPLWLTKPLPQKVRVEFDATSLSAEGDLKFEIFGDGRQHASGYIVIFGGWSNKLDVIARLDEHGKDRKAQASMKVQPNKTYKIAAERTSGTLRWFVDGKLVMEYEDKAPLRGAKHAHFAFNDWEAPVRFDNLKVYELR